MALADARALYPDLEVQDDKTDLIDKLLNRLAAWCIRFTPVVAVDPPDGLLLDATGCTHLWGGDAHYIYSITEKLNQRGYDVRLAIADTAALAWGVARFGKEPFLITQAIHLSTLMSLPPEALRLEADVLERRLGGLRQSSEVTGNIIFIDLRLDSRDANQQFEIA